MVHSLSPPQRGLLPDTAGRFPWRPPRRPCEGTTAQTQRPCPTWKFSFVCASRTDQRALLGVSSVGRAIRCRLCWDVTRVECGLKTPRHLRCADAAELTDAVFSSAGRGRRERSPRQGGEYLLPGGPCPVGDAGQAVWRWVGEWQWIPMGPWLSRAPTCLNAF